MMVFIDLLVSIPWISPVLYPLIKGILESPVKEEDQ